MDRKIFHNLIYKQANLKLITEYINALNLVFYNQYLFCSNNEILELPLTR